MSRMSNQYNATGHADVEVSGHVEVTGYSRGTREK